MQNSQILCNFEELYGQDFAFLKDTSPTSVLLAEGSEVSVFKGKVTKVFNVPGMGKIVLINHGKYFTAYARLASVSVQEGQHVDSKQNIGVVDTNEEGVTEVQFQIWNMDKKLDPEAWLKN